MSAFLDGNPYEPAIYFHTTAFQHRGQTLACKTDFTIRMRVNQPCEPMWSVKIGEILHNFRSALDHTVFQTFVLLKETIPDRKLRHQFPVFLNETEFDRNSLKMLDGIGNKATALIKSLQPFSVREDTGSPLWHLTELSNFDKHRMIHLTGGTLEAFDFVFPPLDSPGNLTRNVRKRGAFEDHTIIAEGTFIGTGPPYAKTDQVKVHAKCLFNIVFDERTPAVGEFAVIDTLLNIADRVREVLETIGREIFGRELSLARPADSTRPK